MDKQEFKEAGWSEVTALLTTLYRVVNRLEELFPGRKFTPDGHLVGSIGEAMAARMSGPQLEHDATSADRQTLVQINSGEAGHRARAEPQHLLVLRFDPSKWYNGRGHAPWAAAGKIGQSLSSGCPCGKVCTSECLPLCNEVDLHR